jgi:hypothetical protein
MKRIEIYGIADTQAVKRIERFCEVARYAHTVRCTHYSSANFKELKDRCASHPLGEPQIFIGEEHIGNLADLMALPAFAVQQKICE